MLARPSEMSRVLDLCETALRIVDFSNPDRLNSGVHAAGTFIAHCYDVKIVLTMPVAPQAKRLLDIWHNGIVLSVEWDFDGATIAKFNSGKWEDRLRYGADALHPRMAAGWS